MSPVEPNESNSCQKTVVSVSEMARMVGLSRARFYQLIGSAFPEPIRLDGNRPAYDRRLQEVCLRVRRQNQGIDGRPVLFYAKLIAKAPKPPKATRGPRRQRADQPKHGDLVEALGQLGIEATDAQVTVALPVCFPEGVDEVEEGEIIAAVYRHLRRSSRQDPADNVGR